MIHESTPEQKRTFRNMVELSRKLQAQEREAILQIIEGAHVPPQFRYHIRTESGLTSAAMRFDEFIGAIFYIAREAFTYGVNSNEPADPSYPARFSQKEVDSYIEHQPRKLSVSLVEIIAAKIPHRMIGLAASSLLGSIHVYLLHAKKTWPNDWMRFEFSDLLPTRKPVPAMAPERFALIKRLADMRLSGVRGALSVDLDAMDENALLSSMDASILALTEQYFQLTEQAGFGTEVAIHGLHKMRAEAHQRINSEQLPDFVGPYTLDRYTGFYLQHVHSHGVKIDDRLIPVAIRMVCAFYGRLSTSCFVDNSSNMFRN